MTLTFVISRNASACSLLLEFPILSVFRRVNIVELCELLKFFGGQGHFKSNISLKKRTARIMNGILRCVEGICVYESKRK